MAKDQALQFIARVNEDAALRDKLQTVSKEGINGLVRVGKEVGFDFSTEEFESTALEQWGSRRSDEVTDDELDGIAGGAFTVKFGAAQKFFAAATVSCIAGR